MRGEGVDESLMRRGRKEASDAGSSCDMGLHTDAGSGSSSSASAGGEGGRGGGGGGGGGGHYTSSMFGLRAEGYGEWDTCSGLGLRSAVSEI